MGVLGWRWGSRRGREEAKSALALELGKEMAGRGVRRSEEMVMGSAKRVGLEVKAAKAAWRSSDAREQEAAWSVGFVDFARR